MMLLAMSEAPLRSGIFERPARFDFSLRRSQLPLPGGVTLTPLSAAPFRPRLRIVALLDLKSFMTT